MVSKVSPHDMVSSYFEIEAAKDRFIRTGLKTIRLTFPEANNLQFLSINKDTGIFVYRFSIGCGTWNEEGLFLTDLFDDWKSMVHKQMQQLLITKKQKEEMESKDHRRRLYENMKKQVKANQKTLKALEKEFGK